MVRRSSHVTTRKGGHMTAARRFLISVISFALIAFTGAPPAVLSAAGFDGCEFVQCPGSSPGSCLALGYGCEDVPYETCAMFLDEEQKNCCYWNTVCVHTDPNCNYGPSWWCYYHEIE